MYMSKDRKCNCVCDDCSIKLCPYEDKTHLTDEELREELERINFELEYWFSNGSAFPED